MESSRSFRLLRSTIGRIIIATSAGLLLSILCAWLITRSGWMTPANQIYILSALLLLCCGSIFVLLYFFVYKNSREQLIRIQRSVENVLEDQDNPEFSDGSLEEFAGIMQAVQKSKSNIRTYAQAIHGISHGDLTIKVSSTQKGILPAEVTDLVNQLQNTFSSADGSMQTIQQASEQLLEENTLTRDSLTNVYNTIQQMASNSEEQSKSVQQTAESIGQLTRAIQGVAEGAQDQASAVAKAAQITSMMTETIQSVSESIRAAAKKSDDASNTAKMGTKTVEQTVTGMMQIKQKVDETAEKIELMAEHSEKIGEIVGTIDDISSQTNLLALNAAIEAARAESQAEALIEYLLNKQMLSQAQLVNQILMDGEDRPSTFWADLARQSGLDVISVANEDGVNVHSSDERLIGFRYSDDPKEQSYAFRKMILDGSGYVCQPPKKRNVDGKLYKYIGVVRKDRPGAIQVGFNAESLSSFKLQVGGFAVVANEVYRLAESSKESAHEISRLVREMQKRMDEVKTAMQMSTIEVEKGFSNADEANKALLAIVDSTNEVSRESVQAAEEAEKMTAYADDLVSSVDSVSAVVEENTATTEEMAAHSNEVNLAMDSIALVSGMNSESIGQALKFMEDVRITNEKINSKTKGLQQSTSDLLKTLQYFNLKENQGI